MVIKSHIARRVRALLVTLSHSASSEWEIPRIHEESSELLRHFPRRKPPSKLPKSLQSRRPAKAQIHKENTKALRAAVMKRSKGKCELCGWAPWEFGGLEMHHLLAGSGRRREQQSVATCMAICRSCHQDYHDGRMRANYVAGVRCWAGAHGYPVPVSLKGTARSAPESVTLAIKDTQS